MQWKAKYTTADYSEGTTRLKRVFAWLPTYINGVKVWLETYEILQVYVIDKDTVLIEEKQTVFSNGFWKNLSKRCK